MEIINYIFAYWSSTIDKKVWSVFMISFLYCSES